MPSLIPNPIQNVCNWLRSKFPFPCNNSKTTRLVEPKPCIMHANRPCRQLHPSIPSAIPKLRLPKCKRLLENLVPIQQPRREDPASDANPVGTQRSRGIRVVVEYAIRRASISLGNPPTWFFRLSAAFCSIRASRRQIANRPAYVTGRSTYLWNRVNPMESDD